MAIISAEEFLAVLKKSELLTNEQFAEAQDATLLTSKASELADMLIRQGTITPWQADQLLAGRSPLSLGNYMLMDLLGRGGMGSVFLAKHRTMKRRVALKVISKRVGKDPASLERFLAEARSIAALDHPNIVRAYDVDKEGDRFYIVMEYVEGQDLEAIVREQGLFDYEAVAYCIRQAAEGLAHAHSRNMVHCDIKPSNLLLSDQGTIKILDMGMARLIGDDGDSAEQADQKVLGTVDYMAPEQAMEGPDFDHRADIYSLGCTLYFLLTGRPPFNEGTLTQRIVKHQTTEPPDILQLHPDAPRALVEICKKMMAKDPADRYQSTEQIAGLLNDWENSQAENENAEQRQQAPKESSDKTPAGQLARSLAMEELPSSDKVAAGPALGEKESLRNWSEEQQTVLLVAAAVVFAIVILSVALVVMIVREEPEHAGGPRIAAHTVQADDASQKTAKPAQPDAPPAEPDKPSQPASPPDVKTSQGAESTDKAKPADKTAKAQDAAKRGGKDASQADPAEPAKPSRSQPEAPGKKTADKSPQSPDSKTAVKSASDASATPPPRPEDPFAEFPTAVDLPKEAVPSQEPDEKPQPPFQLAKIYPKPDSVLQIELVGGDAALAGKDRFVLTQIKDDDTSATAWLVQLDHGRQSDNIARISRHNDDLLFEWLQDDAMDMADNLKNCGLDITIDDKTRTLVLQRPRQLGPLKPDLKSGTSTTVLTSNSLPDAGNLRLEVTGLQCGETGKQLQSPPVLNARQHEDIKLNVKELEELFVRISYAISGGETQVKLECFCKHSGAPRAVRLKDSEWKKLQAQGVDLAQTIKRFTAELARQKRPTQASARKQKRLEAIQKRYEEIVALFKFKKAVSTNGKVSFREYIDDGGRQIELSNSNVPEHRRENTR